MVGDVAEAACPGVQVDTRTLIRRQKEVMQAIVEDHHGSRRPLCRSVEPISKA
jgi:hypothetical protein